MTDRDAFIQAICASPGDDLPRLVYADWLEENGQAERAEFIRLQIRMATASVRRVYADNGGQLQRDTRRVHAITRRRKKDWLAPMEPGEPRGTGYVGQTCLGAWNQEIRVVGIVPTAPDRRISHDPETGNLASAVFYRGFVESIRSNWNTVRELLPHLIGREPIRSVAPYSKSPDMLRESMWVWWDDNDGHGAGEVFHLLDGDVKGESSYRSRVYHSRRAAGDAMSRALIEDARHRISTRLIA